MCYAWDKDWARSAAEEWRRWARRNVAALLIPPRGADDDAQCTALAEPSITGVNGRGTVGMTGA
eukprot:gene46269-49672_t